MVFTIEFDDTTLTVESEQKNLDKFYGFIQQNPEAHHKHLLKYYEQNVVPNRGIDEQLGYLATVLRSALWVGDFLNIAGYIYKTSKKIDTYSTFAQEAYLPSYYEIGSLYNFYENDIPEALKQIDWVLQSTAISTEMRVRCMFYRLAMLLAAHLPSQGLEDIKKYKLLMPELVEDPVIALLNVVYTVDANRTKEEVIEQLEQARTLIFALPAEHPAQVSFNVLEKFIEKKTFSILNPLPHLFADGWEHILRLDLWVKAKIEVKFYYNLLVEAVWQKRKKVF